MKPGLSNVLIMVVKEWNICVLWTEEDGSDSMASDQEEESKVRKSSKNKKDVHPRYCQNYMYMYI